MSDCAATRSEIDVLHEIGNAAYELATRSEMASLPTEAFDIRNRVCALILEWRLLRG